MRTNDQYTKALFDLAPQGRLMPSFADDSELKKLFRTVGQGLLDAENAANVVANDRMYDVAGAFTADWERVLGLPFAGLESISDSQRLGIIKVKLNRPATCTPLFLIETAAAVGYAITVSQFDLTGAETEYLANGTTQAGAGRAADADNYLRVQINAPLQTAIYFRAGAGRAGDQLVEYGNDALEIVIKYFAPAHAIINFNYS